jgi:hypothetical protein
MEEKEPPILLLCAVLYGLFQQRVACAMAMLRTLSRSINKSVRAFGKRGTEYAVHSCNLEIRTDHWQGNSTDLSLERALLAVPVGREIP